MSENGRRKDWKVKLGPFRKISYSAKDLGFICGISVLTAFQSVECYIEVLCYKNTLIGDFCYIIDRNEDIRSKRGS